MNEIQIIQNQLRTEKLHFAEIAAACRQALDQGRFAAGGLFARACGDYFTFAATRVQGSPTPPAAEASIEQWQGFLRAFTSAADKHFAPLEQPEAKAFLVTEWRARFPVDADSIVSERTRYAGVKATMP
jgi:hypothetical protein